MARSAEIHQGPVSGEGDIVTGALHRAGTKAVEGANPLHRIGRGIGHRWRAWHGIVWYEVGLEAGIRQRDPGGRIGKGRSVGIADVACRHQTRGGAGEAVGPLQRRWQVGRGRRRPAQPRVRADTGMTNAWSGLKRMDASLKKRVIKKSKQNPHTTKTSFIIYCTKCDSKMPSICIPHAVVAAQKILCVSLRVPEASPEQNHIEIMRFSVRSNSLVAARATSDSFHGNVCWLTRAKLRTSLCVTAPRTT